MELPTSDIIIFSLIKKISDVINGCSLKLLMQIANINSIKILDRYNLDFSKFTS